MSLQRQTSRQQPAVSPAEVRERRRAAVQKKQKVGNQLHLSGLASGKSEELECSRHTRIDENVTTIYTFPQDLY